MSEYSDDRLVLKYFEILKLRKWFFALFFILILTLSASYAFLKTPVYRSICKLLIEKNEANVVSFAQVYDVDKTNDDYYQTQYKLIQSRTIFKKVMDKLDPVERVEFKLNRDPIQALTSIVSIQPIRKSRLVNIVVEHPDPVFAAKLANLVAETYIDENLNRSVDTSHYAVNWLQRELKTAQTKMLHSEQILQEYISENKLVDIPNINEGSKEEMVEMLKKDRVRLVTELSGLSKRYKSKHPKIIEIQSKIRSIDKKIESEMTNVIGLSQKAIEYRNLKREVDANKEIYQLLLSRTKETDVFDGLKLNNISIVDKAEVPAYPVWPQKRRILVIGFLLALISGAAAAFLVEYMDDSIKSLEDAESFLKLPVVGSIPDVKKVKGSLHSKIIDFGCYEDPKSSFAESFRFAHMGIMLTGKSTIPKTILVTSSSPQEGKTTDIINLASTIANSGEKVLLIDADLRKPRLHKVFKSYSEVGLSEYLVSHSDHKKMIVATQVENLSIITSGPIPPNPSELLRSENMEQLLNKVKEDFDYIFIDSPPVLSVADSIIIGRITDGILYIVQSNKSSRSVISRGIKKLADAKLNVLGIILNRIRPKRSEYYYYRYGDNKHRQSARKKIGKVEKKKKPELTKV